MKHVNDHSTYLCCDVFENLVHCLGSLVESLLCLLNPGGAALQILIRFGKVLLEFFDASFGVLNLRLDLLFRLLVTNQRFVLGSDDVIKIVQPCLGSSELFFLKLDPMTVQTKKNRASRWNTYCVVRRAIWVSNRCLASLTACATLS